MRRERHLQVGAALSHACRMSHVHSTFQHALCTVHWSRVIEHSSFHNCFGVPLIRGTGKPTCVLGFGSSCYPRFCAAAGVFHGLLLSAGATAIMGVTKVDALSGEEQTVWAWVQSVVQKLSDMDCINSMQAADLVQRLPITNIDKVHSRWGNMYAFCVGAQHSSLDYACLILQGAFYLHLRPSAPCPSVWASAASDMRTHHPALLPMLQLAD